MSIYKGAKARRPTFSILVSSRKDSKYLAKFLFSYLQNTALTKDCEVLVMCSKQDTWNRELMAYFEKHEGIRFFVEDWGLGRAGLHKYFNHLAKEARGHWIVYFCDDHNIVMPSWDRYILEEIRSKELNHNQINVIVPKFDNVGTMNHILSWAWLQFLGQEVGRHGWIDSYINGVLHGLPKDRVHLLDEATFHDFTHDVPTPMQDAQASVPIPAAGLELPPFESQAVHKLIEKDVAMLNAAIELGR
jgi:hypothetical protein